MRKCKNWLKSLNELVEDTESPRKFWLWSGIYTLTSALGRKVWIPWGLDNLYPNIYVFIIAPPGIMRKGPTISLAKKFLEEVGVAVASDSSTKRALTQEMAELVQMQSFTYDGKIHPHCSISVISKELSSLLAIEPKALIEALTDLFDSHDVWKYKTSGKGEDKLYGVCVNLLAASTPTWIAENLPQGAIGGGFTSRIIMVHSEERHKTVAFPSRFNPTLYKEMVWDLSMINQLTGEFTWTQEARDFFIDWYDEVPKKLTATADERMHAFIGRIHICALKVAAALHVAYSSKLEINIEDVGQAIDLIEDILQTAPKAFGGQGRNMFAVDVERLLSQIRARKTISLAELMTLNYRHLTKEALMHCLESLETMGLINRSIGSSPGSYLCRYCGG